jgi:hypothetical protein
MRWYNIAAKQYDLDHSEQFGSKQNLDGLKRKLRMHHKISHETALELKKAYKLHEFVSFAELRLHYQARVLLFRHLSVSKDLKAEAKTRKIVFNIKQYADYIYRQFIKAMR